MSSELRRHPPDRRRPRIGVDFHVLDGKYQGSRSHLIGLFSELVASRPDWDFFFFLGRPEKLAALPGFDRPNVTGVRMADNGPVIRLGWQLPALCRRNRLDILHTQYIAPLWSGAGSAVTVHDILFESHPQFFKASFALRSRLLVRRAAHRADMLFTVSDFSRDAIARRYGIDAHRIHIVHNAVDPRRFHPGKEGSEWVSRRSLTPQGYILTVGRIEPRKNHVAILRAYTNMQGTPPPLVIVGQRDFGDRDFESALADLSPMHRVLVLADVDDDELPALYRHALVFVYPSFAEGFGLPPLEALASGAPVVSTRTAAIAEVVADAGILVDPHDVRALAAALEEVCADAGLRRSLAAKGLRRASLFTWERSARVLGGVYDAYLASIRR
jgi:glycosyltransferase involved in cell wall biosynthesis